MSCVISAEIFFPVVTYAGLYWMGDIWYVSNNIIGLGCNSSEGLAFSD